MTSELEAEMDNIANGRTQRTTVVGHSRQLLANVMDELIAKAADVGEVLKDASADDAKVGACPKSGHDLLIKSSAKTRGQFVGCSGWPECDVTYPLPQGKIDSVDEVCATCGTAAGQGHPVPHQAADHLPRPRMSYQPRAGDQHRHVQGMRRGGPRG